MKFIYDREFFSPFKNKNSINLDSLNEDEKKYLQVSHRLYDMHSLYQKAVLNFEKEVAEVCYQKAAYLDQNSINNKNNVLEALFNLVLENHFPQFQSDQADQSVIQALEVYEDLKINCGKFAPDEGYFGYFHKVRKIINLHFPDYILFFHPTTKSHRNYPSECYGCTDDVSKWWTLTNYNPEFLAHRWLEESQISKFTFSDLRNSRHLSSRDQWRLRLISILDEDDKFEYKRLKSIKEADAQYTKFKEDTYGTMYSYDEYGRKIVPAWKLSYDEIDRKK